MLRQRLDRKDGNLPNVTDVLDESSKLAEREFGHVMRYPEYRYKGIEIRGMLTKRNLSQRR